MSIHDQMKSTVINADFFQQIGYSTVWEDETIITEGLQPKTGGCTFSITSGGDFSLNFLAFNNEVISLDFNPRQSFLLEFKRAAIKALEYDELWQLIGLKGCSKRMQLYAHIKEHLSAEAIHYFNGHEEQLKKGIMVCGKQDKYLHMIGRAMLLLQGKKLVNELFACEKQEQQRSLYDTKFNALRWKLVSSLIFSRRALDLFFHKDHFRFAQDQQHPASIFRRQTEQVLRDLPLRDNFYFHWAFFKTFADETCCPLWLQKSNFETIKENADRLTIATGEFEQTIFALPDNSIDRFNFSNIFDWIDEPAFKRLFGEVKRVARDGARLCYWTNAVNTKRDIGLLKDIHPEIRELTSLSKEIFSKSRTPGYSSCTMAAIT